MGYQPWPQNQIDPMLIIPLSLDSGTEDLAGASYTEFAVYFHRVGVQPSSVAGVGQLAVMQLNPGQLIYKLASDDVSIASYGSIEVQRTLPSTNGGETVIYDAIPFNIVPS